MSDADEAVELIGAVSRSVRRRMRAALAPFDLPPALARALRTLAAANAPMRPSELAGALHIERRSATDVVEQLTQRGLVERHPDPSDRRATVLELTADGRRMVAAIAKIRASVARKVAAPLDDAELAELRRLLTRLTDADAADDDATNAESTGPTDAGATDANA